VPLSVPGRTHHIPLPMAVYKIKDFIPYHVYVSASLTSAGLNSKSKKEQSSVGTSFGVI
jgi:hypothetical protein